MNIPTFDDAIKSENIFDYELSRNVLGWQISFSGGNLATCISKEEAFQILEKMEREDKRFDEQICLDEENV